MTGDERFDVVVLGGGPAGSSVATLVARRGHSVLLLEKERFPRYRIGESLLPATVHGLCRLLEVEDEVAGAGFQVKRGGTFRWGAGKEPWNFLFAVSPRLAGPSSHAYQVDRMEFDRILLRNAARHGVDVREECPATGVLRDEDGRVRGVRYADRGVAGTVRARYVVDASGSTGRLWTAIGGSRHYSDFFRNIAVFGYFHGGKRLPGPDRGNILCAAFDEGWCWYIPLSDELTSVGAVVDHSRASAVQADRVQAFLDLVGRCDIVSDHLADATRVTEGVHGQVRVRKDYSYATDRFHADGMLLVGDAACFVDPVFSTGVHLATYGALLAARSINSVLSGDLPEAIAMAEFEGRYRREYSVFHEFLTAFYDVQQHEDTYFWQARKATGIGDTDLEAFATLVGGMASGDTGLAAARRRLVTAGHELSAGIAATGPAQTPSGERMATLFRTPVVREVMTEGSRIQAGGVPGRPLLPGGLVPSADELGWATVG
ncbi:halogenation protein CepH [Saccharothrix tamanrassetensis]|uniref:Halogenation protein CepH n=1 Tax=Saccharothrix tamanrassetensis TaxID=1051531 RepID=A0A841CCT1_9PSEU|nr:tryptophan 7-halogenase [Saccharothrix tamanrassetensis]MBB5953825.1 halogenation protein CepH [Saccharothrix tamanrassetensis]